MTSFSASSDTSTDPDGTTSASDKTRSTGGILAEGTSRSVVRIALYYLLFLGGVGLLFWLVPNVREAVSAARLEDLVLDQEITQTIAGQLAPSQGFEFGAGWYSMGVAAVSMLGALVIMIPVAWSYILIKRRGGYDQSIVHTLLILPVAVTGIVMIVKGSLALAFSLAVIVAAVRFRTTIEDTKDAVYVFLAIGVGLACGVQLLHVALVLSIVFNAVNLTLWKTNFGNIYADQMRGTSTLTLGDILAGPGSTQTALSIGDKALLSTLSPTEIKEAATHVARLERYLEAEEEKLKERKKYGILMVHTREPGETQNLIEGEIERFSVRWRLTEILPGKEGFQVLEYLVRLREEVSVGAFVDGAPGWQRTNQGRRVPLAFRAQEKDVTRSARSATARGEVRAEPSAAH